MADNTKLLKNLFGAMQEAIFLGDPLKERRFACFMQPGELIPLDIQELDSSKDMYLQSQFCNKVIDTSIVNRFDREGYVGNKELLGSVDEIYSHILTRNSIPHKALDEDTIARREAARTKLDKWFPKYEFYSKRVGSLQTDLLTARSAQVKDPAVIADLQRKLNDANKEWKVFGYKAEYDAVYADYMRMIRPSPATYMQELNDLYEQYQKTDPVSNLNYLQTHLSIPISSWNQIKWNQFSSTVSESDQYEYSKSTSWSGGASGGWGLWSFGGGASGNSQYRHDKSSATIIKLTFDYIIVSILRPWIKETLLQERFWTWNRQFGGSLISDGGNLGLDQPVRPVGTMPVLVNKMVIVRNVKIQGDFQESEMTYYRNEINASASVGWGCFSISGRYKSVTEEKRATGTILNNEISMPHPQIIAKMGILLPACPNPDRSLQFDPADAWFPEYVFNTDAKILLEKARKLDEISIQQQADIALVDATALEDSLGLIAIADGEKDDIRSRYQDDLSRL